MVSRPLCRTSASCVQGQETHHADCGSVRCASMRINGRYAMELYLHAAAAAPVPAAAAAAAAHVVPAHAMYIIQDHKQHSPFSAPLAAVDTQLIICASYSHDNCTDSQAQQLTAEHLYILRTATLANPFLIQRCISRTSLLYTACCLLCSCQQCAAAGRSHELPCECAGPHTAPWMGTQQAAADSRHR
jgi:hypothetical protein